MQPRDYQESIANEALSKLREHSIAYLAMEERTGKSLTSLLVAERADVQRVLIVTKKGKPLAGWRQLLQDFPHKKQYTVTNYHQVKNLTCTEYDLVILDEAHNYITGLQQRTLGPSKIWLSLKPICRGKPIMYLSATPYPQGPYMLYYQFALSSWSPWVNYSSYRSWHQSYGIATTVWVQSVERAIYTKTDEARVLACCEHLFISYTRKELGFVHEPKDQLHYVDLHEKTKDIYNSLLKDRFVVLPIMLDDSPIDIVADTASKLRFALHMLEGGVYKQHDNYGELFWETSKVDYIKKHWGDSENVAIMYNYIAEGVKLRRLFKHAHILQSTTHAEGTELSHVDHLIIYSQDFSTGRFTQRRARQASKARDKPIDVHFLLVDRAVSAQVYKTVSVNKQNFVDSVFKKVSI